MQNDTRSDVVHCPSCDEDVPETLYCLNCGYPLYKIEKETMEEPTEEIIVEETIEESQDVDEGVSIKVPEPELEVEEIEDFVANEEEDEVQPIIEAQEVENEEEPQIVETMEEPMEPLINETDEEDLEVVPEPVILEETVDIEEETLDKPLFSPDEMTPDFAPDPMTREVMENLGKNITLKIRLVKLLETEQVKEDTFRKLFNSYVEQGEIWVTRRAETIRRFKTDIEGMQKKLETAQEEFELLEIRRSIGDTSEEEYGIKAPAYKWDMEHLDREIKNRNAGLAYLDNLSKLVPEEEVENLKKMVTTEFSSLQKVEHVSLEIIDQIKDTLRQALNMLE
jgi:hypothetical protein